MVYALVCALVTGAMAAQVTGQALRRRRPHQAVWAVSLWMAALASLSYVVSLRGGPGAAAWFRVYYALGALLMAAYLGVGSVYLGFGPRAGHATLVAVTALGLAGAVGLLGAPVDPEALAALAGGAGRGVLALPGWTRGVMVALNAFGTLAVAGVALRSALDVVRRRAAPGYLLGNALIALGVLVLGAAGSAARWGNETLFWPAMTLGWLVVYGGFLAVTRARHAAGTEVAG